MFVHIFTQFFYLVHRTIGVTGPPCEGDLKNLGSSIRFLQRFEFAATFGLQGCLTAEEDGSCRTARLQQRDAID